MKAKLDEQLKGIRDDTLKKKPLQEKMCDVVSCISELCLQRKDLEQSLHYNELNRNLLTEIYGKENPKTILAVIQMGKIIYHKGEFD